MNESARRRIDRIHARCWWALCALCVSETDLCQVEAPAQPKAVGKEVLFSKAFVERSGLESVVIQTGADEVLVMDKPGPFTLYDPTLKKARKLFIIAKTVSVDVPAVIRAYDPADVQQRPLQVPSLPGVAPSKGGSDADHCQLGGNGVAGGNGADGKTGADGFNAPLIVIDVLTVTGRGVITITDRGGTGGQGQDGQIGGDGGRGGRGGDAVDHLTDCACGGGAAGIPGDAGNGGRGGAGGTGGRGGTVLVSKAVKTLAHAGRVFTIDVTPGDNGPNGNGGTGGKGGLGNQGGSGSSHCSGGAGKDSKPDKDKVSNPDTLPAVLPGAPGQVSELKTSAWQ
jgi:hypothetical protein